MCSILYYPPEWNNIHDQCDYLNKKDKAVTYCARETITQIVKAKVKTKHDYEKPKPRL